MLCVDRDELEAFVAAGLTVREIAAQTGKGYSTVRYWLAKHALATRHRGPGRASRLEGLELVCKRHGRLPFVTDSHGTRCPKCRSERVAARRRRLKQILVDEAGGRCALCGYDRYVGALHFHHVNPGEKAFALGQAGLTRSIAALRAEAAKCRLLCSNCHAEVEGGITALV
jgi:5-methylcytosine-specific restriction endonuclease McrA